MQIHFDSIDSPLFGYKNVNLTKNCIQCKVAYEQQQQQEEAHRQDNTFAHTFLTTLAHICTYVCMYACREGLTLTFQFDHPLRQLSMQM